MGRLARGAVAVTVAGALIAGGAVAYARSQGWIDATIVEERCVFSGSNGVEVVLDLDQSRMAAIIAGRSVARGMNPRAATIALATAYQESGLRNLDHGDRDSEGLFQQRPSQGWGTPAQIKDPAYASDRFYDALLKVPGWQNADINDTAQKVQRSGHPQAYRKHEPKARVLAEVLTGQRAVGVRCVRHPWRTPPAPRPASVLKSAQTVLGPLQWEQGGQAAIARPETPEKTWALGAYAVIHGPDFGITGVGVNDWQYAPRTIRPGVWADLGAGRSDRLSGVRLS